MIRINGGVLLAIAGATVATPAHAYTISNLLTQGCHESITYDALRRARHAVKDAAPRPTNRQEQALIDDLQFKLDGDMKDFDAASLVLGVRDNDVKGQGAQDLSTIAQIHGNPDNQREHCLRGSNEKEPDGSARAVADCREFILGRVGEALDAVDARGRPDPGNLTALTVHLSIRGKIDAALPTFWVRIGQAMHALQDSFTHTYRTPDETKITVVLDWIDDVGGNLDPVTDGPPHSGELDRCDDPDEIRRRRHELAIESSSALLEVALAPDVSKAEKLARVGVVLDRYMGYVAGCTYANNWCDAPEATYQAKSGCGCGLVGVTTHSRGAMIAFGMLAVLGAARVARRRRSRASRVFIGLVVASAALAESTPASAQEAATPEAAPPPTVEELQKNAEKAAASPPPPKAPVPEAGPANPSETAFGVFVGGAGSFDKPAFAASGGLRLRLSKQWTLGLDGEWNPFVAINGLTVRTGVVNVYADAILRFPLAYENFNLRVSASLGGSYLLTELYGAPQGSMGLFFGLHPLGIEWKATKSFYLIVNPLGIDVPIPQLHGVPFLYPQYRISVGLEFYAG